MAMRVGYFSGDKGNPYQERFYSAVASKDIEVSTVSYNKLLNPNNIKEFDIVHFDWLHTHYKHRNSLFAKAKLWSTIRTLRKSTSKQKFIHTFHNVLSHDSYLDEAKERLAISAILGEMDAIFGFTHATLRRMVEEFPETTAISQFVVPHGHYIDDYPLSVSQAEARLRLGLDDDSAPLFLFFGGLRENKGITDLLEVFAEVHARTGAQLLVAGGGGSQAVRSQLCVSYPWLNFHGHFIEEDKVPLYFTAADIVALPFRSILNSGSAILAASMGKCAVMPSIDSLTEPLLKDSIFTYPAGDNEGLLNALVDAATVPSYQLVSLGAQSREQLQLKHSWEKVGGIARDAYTRILTL